MKRAFAVLFACLLMACSGSKLTPQDETNIAAYEAQQQACIAAHAPDKAAIDACRAQVKQTWDTRFNAQFDGGFGATDAGGQ